MTPYDRAWDMGSYTEYMWVYDGICQVVRIPDAQYIPCCTFSTKYIPVCQCTCMYLVSSSTQLIRTWIVLHLKHQDVLYCTWEVYTCMIRPESNAPTIEKPSFFFIQYIQVYTMPVWYMLVYTSTSQYENLIPVYTGMRFSY